MNNSIVIIENDKGVVFLIRFSLVGEGFNIISVPDGISGLRMVKEEIPDLVIINHILPDCDGLEVCKEIRKDPKTNHIPVIILTVKNENEYDGILALELGADDYILKPFSSREVLAKVKALLRRTNQKKAVTSKFFYKDISIDTLACIVKDQKRVVELTPKEFGLLVSFIRNKGQVMSRRTILDCVWGLSKRITPRTVDNHVRNLRKKIPVLEDSIITVKKFGYKLEEE